MNKKIIGLVASGMLVLSYGNVYAMETFEGNDSNNKEHMALHEGYSVYKIEETQANGVYEIEEGKIKVYIGGDNRVATVVTQGAEVFVVHMKGGNGFNCYVAEDSFTNMVCPPNNGGNIPSISHITIFYKVTQQNIDEDGDGIIDGVDLDGDGVVDKGTPSNPENPEVPEVNPPSGDLTNIVGLGVLSGISGLALAFKLFLNRKDKKNK